VVRSAVDAMQGELAKVVHGIKKDDSVRTEREAALVLWAQMQAWVAEHPNLVTQRHVTEVLLRAQALLLTSAISETGGCLQVSPAHTRDSLGIKGLTCRHLAT
jgi:hypothetical protein